MLDLDLVFGRNVREHLEREVEIIAQVLHLRALAGVEDIFQDERVDGETSSDIFDKMRISIPSILIQVTVPVSRNRKHSWISLMVFSWNWEAS